jgi:Nucleotidyl transferase AbiEii toxin, Type IV TA system
MQLDVGFGDVVTPAEELILYPTLLDFPAAELSAYPRETVVAEKFQAMVYLRTANSRMKDFYDLWLLASQFPFDGRRLAKAISATFAKRETTIDVSPVAFTPDFTEQPTTQAQWNAFHARLLDKQVPETLSDVVTVLARFLHPVSSACAINTSFDMRWSPGGPWVSGF